MASYLGLEIGAKFVRAIEVEGSAKKPVIKRFGRLDMHQDASMDEELEAALGDAASLDSALLTDFLKRGKFTREPSVATIDSQSCTFREIELPFTGDDQIRRVIKYEAESHIPQDDIDDLVINFMKLGADKTKSRLLVMAARKDRILEKLGILQASGVDPLHMDLDATALYNTVSAFGLLEEHENFAVVHCGEACTTVLIFVDGVLHSTRSVRASLTGIGENPGRLESRATAAVEASDESSEGDADAGDGEAEVEASEDQEDLLVIDESESQLPSGPTPAFLTKLNREFHRMQVTLRLKKPLETVYVTGEGAPNEQIRNALQESFGTEVREWDLLEHVDNKLSDEDAELFNTQGAIPFGAALKLMGHDKAQVDFRREECAYARKFDQIKVPLTCLLMLSLIVVLLFAIYDYRVLQTRQQELAALERTINIQYEALGDPNAPLSASAVGLKRLTQANSKLRNWGEQLKSQLGRSGSIEALPSTVVAWGILSNALIKAKDQIGPFVLQNLDINADPRAMRQKKQATAKLSGVVESPQHLQFLLDALRAADGVTCTEPRTEAAGERLKFDTDITIEGSEIID